MVVVTARLMEQPTQVVAVADMHQEVLELLLFPTLIQRKGVLAEPLLDTHLVCLLFGFTPSPDLVHLLHKYCNINKRKNPCPYATYIR